VSAPSPHRASECTGLLGKLLAQVRPEFRVEVYLADPDDPVIRTPDMVSVSHR